MPVNLCTTRCMGRIAQVTSKSVCEIKLQMRKKPRLHATVKQTGEKNANGFHLSFQKNTCHFNVAVREFTMDEHTVANLRYFTGF